MKLALVPVNVRVGDLANNQIHQALVAEAVKNGASLVVFPELSLIGYPPQDLLHRADFVDRSLKQLDDFHSWLAAKHPNTAVIVGTALSVKSKAISPRSVANCAVFLQGKRREVRAKTLIPFYNVFHESRYFDSAEFLEDSFRAPIEFEGKKIGILICEDSWHEMELNGRKVHSINPTERWKKSKCDFLINISASPFNHKKRELRRSVIQKAAIENDLSIAYVNHFGAQDELLFDGDAFVCAPDGITDKAEASSEILYWKFSSTPKPQKRVEQGDLHDLNRMLVQGIRDYAKKNSFTRAVLGVSGGVDSALVAALAAEALGPQNIIGIAMPSKFSSSHSVEDAELLAQNIGITLKHMPIKMAHSTFQMTLKPFFEGLPEDITEENLQSRLRGVGVMAFSNKLKAMALATGNKSEFAMGYSTLYGDMCGALAPIGDLYKTEVYALSRYLNKIRPTIPERTISKAPSAELKPNQTDQDSLPPYDLLDAILYELIEEEAMVEQALLTVKKRFPKVDQEVVSRVFRSVQLSEFKRNQSPPILRVSKRAFGRGRVYPITSQY